MAVNVVMPHMGESVFEGTVIAWLKQPGDPVAEDEPLVEISTDKIDVELPSPAAGVLLRIVADEGATVEVDETIAVIGEAGEEAAAAPRQAAAEKEAAPQPPEPEPVAAQPSVAPAEPALPEAPPAPPEEPARAAPPVRREPEGRPAGAPVMVEALGVLASPAVRRLARDRGVPLHEVEGTGRMGRITKADVEAYAQGRQAEAAAKATERAREAGEDEELVPLTKMRRAIAEHMVRSKHEAPHVTTVAEVDMTGVAAVRERHKSEYAEEGVKLTYMAFICGAVARALKEYPDLNAEWTDDGVLVKYRINLGIAVSVEDGLVVPVIHDADRLSMLELARAIQSVAEKTRAGKVSPQDVAGATFSITNPGVFGAVISTPIINQPQAAILATGRIADVPAVVNGELAVRKRMYLSLSYDHRVVDGATAVRFLQRVREVLEQADFEMA